LEHKRYECTKNSKRSQKRCHKIAIGGTPACNYHSGEKVEIAKAKGAAITAWQAEFGEVTISAADAVLRMLQMSWARTHLYARLLEAQVAAGVDAGGLIGETRGASPEVGIYATGEAVRGLAALEAAERDRCVRFAKVAHDMGIAEAQIRVAEQQGALLASVIGRVLDRLGLSEAQRALVGSVVPEELRAVAGGET
jgi:hypothetical protein